MCRWTKDGKCPAKHRIVPQDEDLSHPMVPHCKTHNTFREREHSIFKGKAKGTGGIVDD